MFLVVLLGAGAGSVFAQVDAESLAGMSRPMRKAVRYYERGDDMEAMDQFMDILTKGDPSERSMANEYINLITRRMNMGASPAATHTPSPKSAARPTEPLESSDAEPAVAAPARSARSKPIEDDSVRSTQAPASETSGARGDETPAANKALMRREIRARLHGAVEKSLADLKSIEGVRAVMRVNGDPDAIGIPAGLLFQSGIAFQRDASKVLDPLTKLVFALGSAQVVILPEGTVAGDAKVMDMRRTMGISSHLFNAGVAPPRVRVNLLNTQVDVPKALLDFKGVVVVFLYNQPLRLVAESSLGDELGPPMSLGIFPAAFRPSRGQGVIIEFSVSDPPSGLVSWKFQLLQPARDGTELAPLQDVVGGGPVFHQVFWNGKQNYFGEDLAPGRYECILTAVDGKNRQRSLRKWIQILDGGVQEKKDTAKGASSTVSAVTVRAPSADLEEDDKPLVSGVKAGHAAEAAPVKRAGAKRPTVKRPVRGVKPAAEISRWELEFDPGSYQLTSAAEEILAKAAAAVARRSEETLRVIGHSDDQENEGEALSGQRAKMVAGILVNRYQVDSKRVAVEPAAAGGGSKVELEFGRGR
jgi:outer membrane protein OmpA-like peptidoglycan-associated protein